MKRKLLQITLLLACSIYLKSSAQPTRYLDQLYSTNDIEENVSFGFNVDPLRSNFANASGFEGDMATLNGFIEDGQEIPLNYFQSNSDLDEDQQTVVKLFPLTMDVYTPPNEDVDTNRPLIIYIHTGNFLPRVINQGPTGDKKDSLVVNLCKEWARKGYVVAALNYRLGWNPTSTNADIRRGTLLQAVYRAIHDTQTCVRFMRSTVALGNTYGINSNQIVLFGQGSGGYVAQAYATLDDYNSEIAIPKFIDDNGLPYVIPSRDGNINGGPGSARLPDPLQQAGISKDIHMAVNIGGALADISWLEAGDVPMVTLHTVRDPFAPFDNGTVVVPTTNEDVVDVSGGNVFIQKANDLGNNALFATIPDGNDPYTDRARSLYGETFDYILASQPTITVAPSPEGLFPIVLPINTIAGNRFTNQGAPWDWWNFETLQGLVAQTNASLGLTGSANAYDADAIHNNNLAGNPGMSPEKGQAFIDTIQGYVNPRIMCTFSFAGNPCILGVSESVIANTTTLFPNPSSTTLTVQNVEHILRSISLIDITGRIVAEHTVNAHQFVLDRGNLNNGIYLMQLNFDGQTITKKVMFN